MSLQAESTPIAGLRILTPRVFADDRGSFLELANSESLAAVGIAAGFVQTNVSRSRGGVLRGLHYQHPGWQGKLVSVLEGEVFDVAVDLRRESATFGKWHGERLSAENHRQMWIPEGFAHGFAVLSETALVHYGCTRPYAAAEDRTLLWNDPRIGIAWPLRAPILSAKDIAGQPLDQAEPALRR